MAVKLQTCKETRDREGRTHVRDKGSGLQVTAWCARQRRGEGRSAGGD